MLNYNLFCQNDKALSVYVLMSLCRLCALCFDIHFNIYNTCLFLNVNDSFEFISVHLFK